MNEDDAARFLEVRGRLYPAAAVSAAAGFVASALSGDEVLLLDQFTRWNEELHSLDPEEAALSVVGLLASLTTMAELMCVGLAANTEKDPLDIIRHAESVLDDLRLGR